MDYAYKVVPFIGQNRGTLSAADVAIQMESIINHYASHGWEFYQLSDVNIELLGAKAEYVRFDQLIFRTDRTSLSALPQPSPTADADVAGRRAVFDPTADWRCPCDQINPPSTGACLDCGKPR